MSGIEITGSLVVRKGKRGSVLYAKVRVEGEQKWIRLGKLWEKDGRPADGYLTRAQGEVRVEAIKHGDDPIVRGAQLAATIGEPCDVQPTGAMFSEAVCPTSTYEPETRRRELAAGQARANPVAPLVTFP
jgi:hypothetical protein